MDIGASFGFWIKRRRKSLDFTQEALAQRVGCSVATIEKIEADLRRPSRQIAELLAEALEITSADRPVFLKVARGERAVDRLAGVSPFEPQHIKKHNLPVLLIRLIGREYELAEISRLLADPDCRLITLVGPGGVGKTYLAIQAAVVQAAVNHQGAFRDGVFYATLPGVSQAEHLAEAIAKALPFSDSRSGASKLQLLENLQAKNLLLLLDNCEHLLDGAGLIAEIVESSPAVKILATSREPLELYGEWVFELQGLATPDDPQTIRIDSENAAGLFLQRAERAKVGFKLRDADRRAVIRICGLVQGMPLAIELAAAWVRLFSCAEIAAQIERSLDFLSAVTRNIPERHRSMRAVFDHSWKLLSAEEQSVLRKLSVFRGGLDQAAAERVGCASLAQLSSLTAKSLIQCDADGRWDLHEMVRQYSAEKLAEAGEVELVYQQHFDYFLNAAELNEARLFSGDAFSAFRWLVREQPNLEAALERAASRDCEGNDLKLKRLVALMHPELHKTGIQVTLKHIANSMKDGHTGSS
jgi:predicted ATPase/DNA-binding XRE family transcriptional regulator